MRVFYVGVFPPERDGISVKNENLFLALESKQSKLVELNKIDLNRVKRKDLREIARLISAILNRESRLIIGISSAGKSLDAFIQLLCALNKKCLSNSVIMVMGGNLAKEVVNDHAKIERLAQAKRLFVETDQMRQDFYKIGIQKVSIYPNCRFQPQKKYKVSVNKEKPVRCLFFSDISKEKGSDIALQAAAKLKETISIDFYGKVKEDYQDEFTSEIKFVENAAYRGLFRGSVEETYRLMNEYDVLIFPSRWRNEGVPGALIEAKNAGLAIIASDICYNKEIVEDQVDGIILKENTVEMLVEKLKCLDQNRTLLHQLKQGSLDSSRKFYVESYCDYVLDEVTR